MSITMDIRTILLAMMLVLAASTGVAYAQVPEEVQIGVLLPLTGKLSALGGHLQPTTVLASDDFNDYLEANGYTWRVQLVMEDTGASPVLALEKIQALHARGADIVVGPVTSASVSSIMPYANDNNMIVIAPVSSSPALAIPDDSVFRLTPDDRNQGKAMGALLYNSGIDVLIPVWRGDTYGDGLRDAVAADFETRGGTTHDGIRYNPEIGEFSVSMSSLADMVSEVVREYGADRVAVLAISFEEVVPLLQSASGYDILSDVQWFGSQAVAQSTPIISDGIALGFAQNANLTSLQLWQAPGIRADSISERLTELLGEAPNTYTSNVYDAMWLAGMTVLESGSADPLVLRASVRGVADSGIGGALSSTAMNEAGDLILASYRIWYVSNDTWVPGAIYHGDDDTAQTELQTLDSGAMRISYEPNPNSNRESAAAQWLHDTMLLEDKAVWVNETFLLPRDVKLTAMACGKANATYRQDEITICYELVDHLHDMWLELDGDPTYTDTFVLYNMYEIFLHNLGHAILDVYDVPFTGKEETVADQFAALVMSKTPNDADGYAFGHDMLYSVGMYHLYSSHAGNDAEHWTAHDLDMQRFYDISCYLYGTDPIQNHSIMHDTLNTLYIKDLVLDNAITYNTGFIKEGKVSEEWVRSCEAEYKQIEHAFDYMLAEHTINLFGH